MKELTIDSDEALTADLARAGLIVTDIVRPNNRLVVITCDAHALPLVAVVNQGPGERGEAFARLMTKAFVR